jgi:hypothetical protein
LLPKSRFSRSAYKATPASSNPQIIPGIFKLVNTTDKSEQFLAQNGPFRSRQSKSQREDPTKTAGVSISQSVDLRFAERCRENHPACG